MKATTEYWNTYASGFTISWYAPHFEKDENNVTTAVTIVEYGTEEQTENMDLVMVAEASGYTFTYPIELKERKGRYKSDYYGKDGKEGEEGWMYNIEKDGFIDTVKRLHSDWIPIYANCYPDKVIRVWNMKKIDKSDYGSTEKVIHQYNDIPSKAYSQRRYTLMNKQGVRYTYDGIKQ